MRFGLMCARPTAVASHNRQPDTQILPARNRCLSKHPAFKTSAPFPATYESHVELIPSHRAQGQTEFGSPPLIDPH